MRAARLCMALWMVIVLLCASVAAGAAPPQLAVPHGRLGHTGSTGASAIWRSAGGAFVIQASGDLANATGNLERRTLETGEGGAVSVGNQIVWDAATLLDKGAARKLFTTDQSGATIAFDWDSLPSATRALLEQPTPGAPPDSFGELRTDFLRGDRSHEEGQPKALFRKRVSVLGDVVNSTPLIVGAPQPALADSGHAAFRAKYKSRTIAVYVGANDGMLHAFSAVTGHELFAYVPAVLTRHLPALASPAYKARPYVDGSPAVGDALVGASWRSVLASGMGMGARGLFALDVTDPANGPQAIWEFTEADDTAIGHVREPPLIAKVSVGKVGGSAYFAVVSSGINNQAPDGGAALFLLSTSKNAADKWKAGDNYFSIRTHGDGGTTANALSAPALVVSPEGSATRAYAGDLVGNLWRFDFSTMKAHRLFTARDADGVQQPIAHAPKVVHAPGGGYMIVFATGKLIEASDLLPSSFGPQSVYAVYDRPGAIGGDAVNSRAQLAARTLVGSAAGYAIKGESFALTGPDKKSGWYFDLPNSQKAGERAAGSPVSIADAVVIASLLPGAGKDAAPTSRVYVLDALSGFAHAPASSDNGKPVTGELAAIDPTLPLLLADGAPEKGARSATGGVAMARRVSLLGPSGSAAVKINVSYRAGRMGWREVANWKELHEAAVNGK